MQTSDYTLTVLCPKDLNQFVTICGSFQGLWIMLRVGQTGLGLVSVQFSRSVVYNSATPLTAVHQASLSITNSRSPPKPMSIESVMPFSRLLLCRPLLLLPSLFPSIRVFSNESALHIRWPSIGASASASVLPVNIQDWFPLGWTGWSCSPRDGLSGVFSNTTVEKYQFFSTQLSL